MKLEEHWSTPIDSILEEDKKLKACCRCLPFLSVRVIMLCTLCNRVPQTPVVTKRGGYLFERSLIEKYIDEHGRCPVTNEPLTRDDLLSIHGGTVSSGGNVSQLLSAFSVSELLERLRAEWDSVMLEQHSLRQQLAQMQQELAHALQRYEAACHVIAAITKECDELRRESQRRANGAAENERGEEEEAIVLPASLLKLIDSQEAAQRKERKKRMHVSSDLSSQTPASFVEVSQVEVASKNNIGAFCVAIANDLLYTAGTANSSILQYDMTEKRVSATGLGHYNYVHTITTAHEGSCIISASEDRTVKVWKPESSQLICEQTLRYADGVSALSHRLINETYVLVGSPDGSLCISNVELGEQVVVATGTVGSGVTCTEFHPYASLAAIGTKAGELILWNVKLAAADTVLSLRSNTSAQTDKGKCYPNSIDFHPDCVTIVVGFSDSRVLLWDLRKIDEPVAEIMAPNDAVGSSSFLPASVTFEESRGACLAVGTRDVKLYNTAKLLGGTPPIECVWNTLSTSHSAVSKVCWPRSSIVAASCMDGVVRVFNA